MDTCVSILTSPHIKALLMTGSLVVARIVPLVAFTPVFGGQALPARFRFGVSVVLALVFLSVLGPSVPLPISGATWSVLLFKEALVGMTMALIVLIGFEALSAAGSLIDASRGGALAMILDPHQQQQQSITSVLFGKLGVVLFLSVGGPRLLFGALGDSYLLIPIREVAPSHLIGLDAGTATIAWAGQVFIVALRLASPVFLVTILLDLAMGLAGRVAPQFETYFHGLTAKGLLVLAVLLLGMPVMLNTVQDTLGDMMGFLEKLVRISGRVPGTH